MDLLLDVNVVLDLCVPRFPGYADAAKAVSLCRVRGGRVWLYAGSVQTCLYMLARELKHDPATHEEDLSTAAALRLARRILDEFSKDKHWLASLAGEGPVFEANDCEDEQLLQALDRFDPGSIALLTRDGALLDAHPDKARSPSAFISTPDSPKPMDFIDLKAQQDRIRHELESGLHRILHHGRYIMGSEVAELEERLADYVGVKCCISVASGTDALLVPMMAMGIGPGDEVITTPFTFVATGEMIVLLGATPVFVDINPVTYNIDPSRIEEAITHKTKAIMPVSLYGQCAEMDEINAIAERYGVPVIEDAAQSFGATYKGRRSCGLSTVGATSFFPSKPLGGYGDAGACFTDDGELAKAMREIRVHGQDRRYNHPRIGVNGRLDTLQAAVLLAKLAIFDDEVSLRGDIGARYSAMLMEKGAGQSGDSENGLLVPKVLEHNKSVHAQYTIQLDNREVAQAQLKAAGIPTAVHYPIPLNQQPAYKDLCCPDCTPVAARLAQRVMSLPMHPYLTAADQARIVSSVSEAML
jgi:UDP-2-acetamido-2-deoxy-ribo-hexuluronate aminotransferase